MNLKLTAALAIVMFATGCAPIANDATQPIRVGTVQIDGTQAVVATQSTAPLSLKDVA